MAACIVPVGGGTMFVCKKFVFRPLRSRFAGTLKRVRRSPMRAVLASVLLQALWIAPVRGQKAAQPEPDLTKLSLADLTKVQIETVYGASNLEQKVTQVVYRVPIFRSDEVHK